jgi:3-hexulose-6-phosphate synthase
MKLQVAFDVTSYDQLKKIMKDIEQYIDIVEVGTLLIKAEGIGVAKKAKDDYGLPVFADIKCMDAGAFETAIAAEQGADYVTVLASSYFNNIKEVIESCKKNNIISVVDSINSPIERLVYIQYLGIDMIELHTGYINKVGARPWDDVQQIYDKAFKPISLSGGISSTDMWRIKQYTKKVDTLIIGRAIVYSDNPKEEARKIREIADTF